MAQLGIRAWEVLEASMVFLSFALCREWRDLGALAEGNSLHREGLSCIPNSRNSSRTFARFRV